nr:IPT/TIG domain-containing protein [Oceanococcus sp. HetDA_MAG_MS8]
MIELRKTFIAIWWITLSTVAIGQPADYIYDDLNRLVGVVVPAEDRAVVYRYDAAGNISSRRSYNASELVLHGFSPAFGTVGQELTVYGTGFGENPADVSVTVAGVETTPSQVTPTRVVVAIPAGAGGGVVSLITPQGTVTSDQVFRLRP